MDALVVLGKTSMLGSYVYNELCKLPRTTVLGLSKKEFYVDKDLSLEFLESKFERLRWMNSVTFFNTIEVRESSGASEEEFYLINSRFPQLMTEYCEKKMNWTSEFCGNKRNWTFIQHSTTHVFNGSSTEPYSENSTPDPLTIYGKSKLLGESHPHTMTIRCDVIGEDRRHRRGLIEYLKRVDHEKKKSIQGYEDHWWNGITCMEYARLLSHIMTNRLFWQGVRHWVPTYKTNKHQLCKVIQNFYQLDILEIQGIKTKTPINRLLTSIHEFPSVLPIRDLIQQVKEMHTFYDVIQDRGTGESLRVKFCVINLRKSTDRMERIREFFREKNINFYRYPAILGSDCQLVRLNERYDAMVCGDNKPAIFDRELEVNKKYRGQGTLASGWSHLEVSKLLLADMDADAYMVFEDDIKFLSSRETLFDYLKHVPQEVDHINFAKTVPFYPFFPTYFVGDGYYFHIMERHTCNASSYLITKSGALKILLYTNGCIGTCHDNLACQAHNYCMLDFIMMAPTTPLFDVMGDEIVKPITGEIDKSHPISFRDTSIKQTPPLGTEFLETKDTTPLSPVKEEIEKEEAPLPVKEESKGDVPLSVKEEIEKEEAPLPVKEESEEENVQPIKEENPKMCL